jgi:hypothetical protein
VLVAWLTKKLVMCLLLAMAVPVSIWVADKAADQIEQRRGPSQLTRTLRAPGRWRRGEPLLAD